MCPFSCSSFKRHSENKIKKTQKKHVLSLNSQLIAGGRDMKDLFSFGSSCYECFFLSGSLRTKFSPPEILRHLPQSYLSYLGSVGSMSIYVTAPTFFFYNSEFLRWSCCNIQNSLVNTLSQKVKIMVETSNGPPTGLGSEEGKKK